jgi:colicin import membrane protein
MPRRRIQRKTGWLPAAAYATVLHVAVLALLFIGFRAVSRPVQAPAMQATVVRDPSPERDQTRPDEERKRQEVERKKQDEEKRLQAQAQEQQKQKQQQEEEQRKKEEAERKKQADAEKRKREDEQKKQQAERKKQEKERQQQAEQTLREQLADEEKGRSAARTAKLAPEVDKYRAAIRQKVERNWIRPASSRKGLQCTVRVRLIPGGEVLQAIIVRSSGDPVFDRSVENAVQKASPLPLPENAELMEQFREIEFIFRPED